MPQKIDNTIAFKFESRYVFEPTAFAMSDALLQADYDTVWHGFEGAKIY